MNLNSQAIQQYVRVVLYWVFGALATYGVSIPDDRRIMIASVAGTLANLAWTIYGTRLNGLLEQVKAKAGVQEVQVKVDPAVIGPSAINDNTSAGITAKVA